MNGTSLVEMRVYSEVVSVFHDAEHRAKVSGIECDVLLPSFGIAVEVDGKRWHASKERDEKKNRELGNAGIRVIRLREHGLEDVGQTVVFQKTRVREGIRSLMRELGKMSGVDVSSYLSSSQYVNPDLYREMSAFRVGGRGLSDLRPDLAKEWHTEKNDREIKSISTGSNYKAIWKCAARGHEWRQAVFVRVRGNGCPYCSNKKACFDNSLAKLRPDLAAQWSGRNEFGPQTVTTGSGKRVWWVCKKGHEWVQSVNDRNHGRGCPYCSGRGHLVRIRPR